MAEPNPAFDAAHPSGDIRFRSCRGGYLHSVALGPAALHADADVLAEAIMLTADASYLKAALEIRAEIVALGHTPSAAMATPDELRVAADRLAAHRLDDPTGPSRD